MTAGTFASNAETIVDRRTSSGREVFARALDDCRRSIEEEIARERWPFSLRIHVAYLSRLAYLEKVPRERYVAAFKQIVLRAPEVSRRSTQERGAIAGYLARLALQGYDD